MFCFIICIVSLLLDTVSVDLCNIVWRLLHVSQGAVARCIYCYSIWTILSNIHKYVMNAFALPARHCSRTLGDISEWNIQRFLSCGAFILNVETVLVHWLKKKNKGTHTDIDSLCSCRRSLNNRSLNSVCPPISGFFFKDITVP